MVLKTSFCRYCIHINPRGFCWVTGTYKSGRELDEPGECWWYAMREPNATKGEATEKRFETVERVHDSKGAEGASA